MNFIPQRPTVAVVMHMKPQASRTHQTSSFGHRNNMCECTNIALTKLRSDFQLDSKII
jgi:hypothetical protein